MKIMKLVMKNPIQTHVIIGTFWGFENQYVYKIQKGILQNLDVFEVKNPNVHSSQFMPI